MEKVAETIKLNVQKIFKVFLSHANQWKAALLSFAPKAAHKYADDIDARLQIDKVGQLNTDLLEEGGEITLLGQSETVKKLQFEEDS